jgi:hypothetical protein
MLFLDNDSAHPNTIHAGIGFYSRFPEPDEADMVSDGASIPVPFVQT